MERENGKATGVLLLWGLVVFNLALVSWRIGGSNEVPVCLSETDFGGETLGAERTSVAKEGDGPDSAAAHQSLDRDR